jgi:uncharacterized protein (DUF169 family)
MEVPMSMNPGVFAEILEKYTRPATFPVAVKLASGGEELTQRSRKPRESMGNPLAVCQGLNISRTIGWTMVFGPEDHACPVGAVIAGHLPPGGFLEGQVAELYQDDPEVSRIMEAGYPRLKEGSIEAIWLSPLECCEFEPDLVVVYGTPAQMVVLIHAANYGKGEGIRSVSTGRVGCSAWLAGAGSSDECSYMIPGSGERVFGGTQDHEMSFIIPASQFQHMARSLETMHRKGSYRYPVPNMHLMEEPKMPAIYEELLKKS